MSRRLPGPMGVPCDAPPMCTDTSRRAMQPTLLRPLDTCEADVGGLATASERSMPTHAQHAHGFAGMPASAAARDVHGPQIHSKRGLAMQHAVQSKCKCACNNLSELSKRSEHDLASAVKPWPSSRITEPRAFRASSKMVRHQVTSSSGHRGTAYRFLPRSARPLAARREVHLHLQHLQQTPCNKLGATRL